MSGLGEIPHLMSVLAWVGTTADVNPVVGRGLAGSLKDQLVKVSVVHEPSEPLAKFLLVGEVDVTGFTGHVQRVAYASYELVEFWATVAG